MNIEDFLERPENLFFRTQLVSTMQDTLPNNLFLELKKVFTSEEILNWYYSKHNLIENQRPYDLCLVSNFDKVIQLIEREKFAKSYPQFIIY